MKNDPADPPFWKSVPFNEMTRDQWESLCDGCGKCCLHKLEDAESGEIYYTNVACRLLDHHSMRCTRYASRTRWVPDCTVLKPEQIADFKWLPKSCGYRLVHEGRDLPDWHPLVSGDRETIHEARKSMRHRWLIDERKAGDLEDHIIEGEP
ncbi:UPF0260 protein [Iodidimonas nitroreducens]|uniref:UPF0260 protein JCM17846_03440 n=1 Tax=Iodidimonas nitroreducens TaxID=1236968 RepID=A0A5A7N307_9PROT|nr:YcgN family cysteine cluster protein [Iodidimonas nitroreducens]GAK32179.1 hypothetical protein AQ1_00041 [alpha proteobacterium Q-1]GER02662.1 UPF0260 protein [Iodidimonas nitroreducens]